MKHILISLLTIATINKTTVCYAAPMPGQEIVQTAKEAYIFGFPLVLMDIIRRQLIDKAIDRDAEPANVFRHWSEFPPNFRINVWPNADTYYSTAALDLSAGPLVLSLPNTHGRYFMMSILDAYTNVFSAPGLRKTGTTAANFLITGPLWRGDIPNSMRQIKSPTNMALIISRIQVNSKEDGKKVVIPIQKHYRLTPLSAWGKAYKRPVAIADPTVPQGNPNDIVKKMPIEEYFNYLNRLLADNPPLPADKPAMEKFAQANILPDTRFELSAFSPEVQAALKDIPKVLFAAMDELMKEPPQLINGWTPVKTMSADFGTDYTARAITAYLSFGANLAADAVYPLCTQDAEGNKLTGANKYVLHFDKGKAPPAYAFWTLTMYDSDGYIVENPINRKSITSRSKMTQNPDGSTDIYLQHQSPGKDKETNWLPAPAGEFNIRLRIYWPKKEVLDGLWLPPAVKKV